MTDKRVTGPSLTSHVEAISVALGPMPWLTAASRLEHVLMAWGRGYVVEVPVGIGFDVLLAPGPLARDTVRRMCVAGRRLGPVVLGPCGAEFILERGSARDWRAPRSSLVPPGTLVLLPPLEPYLASGEAAREERGRCA